MHPVKLSERNKNRHNEQELLSSINACRSVFNLLTDLIFVFNLDLDLKLINNQAKHHYNCKENLSFKNLTDIKVFPKSFDMIIKQLNRLDHISLPKIKISTIEQESTGQETEIQWTMSYMWNIRKHPIGISLIGKFNFEKNNLAKINYLQSCLYTIIDSVPGDIYWKNTEGVYLGCNNAMVKKSNLKSKSEIIGKTDDELWPGSPFRANDLAVLAANKTTEIQETLIMESGKKFYFISIKTPLKDQNNKTIGLVGNSVDVTEIVNSKAKAEEANNIKTQFLLNMQHDIKTPIAHIIGLSNIVYSMEGLTNKAKEYIGYIKISSERLMNLIVDILHYCDIETTNRVVDEQEWQFSLLELIEKSRDLNTIPIKEKNLKFIIENDPNIPEHLIGNKNKLHRIIINLIDNAIKFTHQGAIKVSTKLVKNLDYPQVLIELIIEDTGIGIPKDKYETIFDRFIRLSPSGSNTYKGLGLGLWMVKQLAKNINGEIYVDSTIDQGSQFRLIFPCKATYL